jgi:hypothetical protein
VLHEGQRLIKPENVKEQILWDKLEGVVVLGLAKDGQTNTLQMSTVTINELVMLSAQLQAHVTCLLGHMKEV